MKTAVIVCFTLVFLAACGDRGLQAQIEKAQKIQFVTIEGKQFPRVRYGSEKEDWGADRNVCHDCGVVKGQFHIPGCDVERCPRCDRQLITCACEK